jgi:predicted DNA binding CopG/RHH family protein
MELRGKFPNRETHDPLQPVTMQLPKKLLSRIKQICLEHDIPRQRLVAVMLAKCLESNIVIDLEKDL